MFRIAAGFCGRTGDICNKPKESFRRGDLVADPILLGAMGILRSRCVVEAKKGTDT
jgi:hypothetical protein